MKRFPPPPNASDLNEPSWRHWFYLISDSLSGAVDITTSPGILSQTQGTFPMAGMNGEILEGDSHEYIMSPGTSLSFDAAIRFLASSTGMGVTLPLFTATEAGLTPLSGGGTSNFLRADGTWATTGSGSGREILSTDRTYYVRTDGSNSNTGLANTSGGAFLTIQKAVDVVTSTLDIAAGVTATIQVADGTYTGAVVLYTFVGAGSVSIVGNTGTPANCIVSTTSANCFTLSTKVTYSISGFKLQTTTSGSALTTSNGGKVIFSSLSFGACASNQISASEGGIVAASGNYAISGGSNSHVYAISGAAVTINNRTVTITGTPAFSSAFIWMDRGLAIVDAYSMTFSGSATGKRYTVNNNSVCFVNGAATTYFPGDVAGTTATGGQYA